ncbi:hypothetical protein ACLMAL_25060 [Nocardia sp. CWNU-33]|uniref:hypothetical protein n=1 Tax=Nocardia sp. CWNU-33 TaxID=3392117 RepID=UPI00398F6212
MRTRRMRHYRAFGWPGNASTHAYRQLLPNSAEAVRGPAAAGTGENYGEFLRTAQRAFSQSFTRTTQFAWKVLDIFDGTQQIQQLII